jgi:hypothetical protein
VGANEESYNNTGLSEATSYYYRVVAFNLAGDSNDSNEADATTYPAAPSDLSATVLTLTKVDLSWTDNSSGEEGFTIERKKESDGTYEEIATVSSNTESYSDEEVSGFTTYYYRISAFNDSGSSDFSNEARVTTVFGGGGDGNGCFIGAAIGSHLGGP